MWWQKKTQGEVLPWYRAPDYKGQMKEADKRLLDGFRMQERHPAARYEDLPEEVQNYISNLQQEVYDLKQQEAGTGALIQSGIGAAILYVAYFGVQPASTIWPYVVGLFVLIVPWFRYRRIWNRNAEEFLPRDHARNPTRDGIIREWELEYLYRAELQKRTQENGDD
ncbi:MAG: hypothetical protein E5V63_03930 [Mesorhizobium sp.]|nr:MAG: hypothetical protein E5V63_03930 [Mesorhizobium sp.]